MENLNLIRKIAWSFHHTTGVEWDDLFQEASLAYLEAEKTFDSTNGCAFTTYAWQCCSTHLKNYIKTTERQRCIIHDGSLCYIDDLKEDIPNLSQEFIDNLTEEAQELVKVILSAPKVFIEIPPKQAKRRLAQTMIRKGWTWQKVWIGINDLKLACK
jgi:DNA-directed RNA polymerase specialized sigma subunit